MTDIDARRNAVLLALQQALLGEVTANLRAVTVQYDSQSIQLEAFFNEQPDEEDKEAMSLVETEVLALFPASHTVSLELTTRPEPEVIPKDRHWVYFRKEPLLI